MSTVLSLIAALLMFSTDIGIDNSFKAYMDYKTITDTDSVQYRMQEAAWTDVNGFRRYDKDRYMIALGSYYTDYKIGQKFKIILEDDTILNCVTGDMKADIHTDETNRYQLVKNDLACIVEFIVDTDELNEECLILGDCSALFPGQIKCILKED